MRAMPFCACATLLVVGPALAARAATAAADDVAEFTPDPAVQAAITQVADANDRPGQQAAFELLASRYQQSPEPLIRELTWFASRARDERQAMAGGAILRRLDVPPERIVRALVPWLATTDAEFATALRNALGGLEGRAPGRRPDFSVYRGLLEDRLRSGEPLPAALVRYLYDADAGMAVLLMMRTHQVRVPDEIKRILWAEHVVSNVLWKQQYGFLKPSEVEPAAASELTSLATHPAWWARLYVAEVMRQHPAFRQADVLDALARDADANVRTSAAAPPANMPASPP